MANLLPNPVIRSRVTSTVVRTIAAFSVVIALAGVLAAIGLVPVYLQAHISRTSVEKTVAHATTTPAEDPAKIITVSKNQIAALKPVIARTKFASDVIQTLVDKRPDGMYFDHLTYKFDPKESMIVLRGELSDPSLLETYRNSLAATEFFTSVKIPVSELALTQTGSFTLEISGKW